jgi:SAM-dependent methyltransferase
MTFFRAPDTADTQKFYKDLLDDERSSLFWGKERFDADRISGSPSVRQYFREPLRSLLRPTDTVLDVGCGAGAFLPTVSPLCDRLVGLDVTPAFVERARRVIQERGLANTTVVEGSSASMPFEDGSFDAVLMVDLLHHLPSPKATVTEVHRVVRPGGLVIVFEPNKLNPLLTLGCVIDRNEWGLLQLGTFGSYRSLFAPHFTVEHESFNGLLIGPDGRVNRSIAQVLNARRLKPAIGWLNPKLQMVFRKPRE